MSNTQRIFIFIFLIQFSLLQAQNGVQITGTAVDEIAEQPVEAATVYLTLKRDSTVIDYSLTDIDGSFNLNVKKINEPVYFIVTDELFGEFEREFDALEENQDLGVVKLSPKINLEGIVITSAPPIRIKNDTLEFNASSFKVRPDANVETLLRQLPGVDIDEDGKITVNGKEVNQILVNGKPFFDKDGKIALENLPAEIIDKVQVTDTKSKKEELSGDKASSNNATINLTIDEDKNKGIMLKAMAGYGTDDRYESSMMFNYFKGNSRLSILGSSNNINSVGFSMNEIFDNMGSMRRSSIWVNDGGGSFGINGMRFGGGKGITQSHLGGLNYSDSFGEKIDFNGNYFYTQTDTKNNNFSRFQNLLPNNIFITESQTVSDAQSYTHNLNTSFEVKIDSTSSIWFEPKYSHTKTRSSNVFNSNTVNESGDLLNESYGETRSEGLNQQFSNSIEYFKSFTNKTELSLSLSNENSRIKSEEINQTNTIFYQTEDPDDLRNQRSRRNDKSDKFSVGMEFNFPVSDSLKLGIGTTFTSDQTENLLRTLDYDEAMDDYLIDNEWLSKDVSSDFQNVNPYLNLKLQKSKFYVNLKAGVGILSQKNDGIYRSEIYGLNLNKLTPTFNLNGNYRMKNNANIYFNYTLKEEFGSAEQLLPIEDLSNPLNTFVGNPDLKTNRSHDLYVGWNKFNFQERTGYNIYLGGSYSERSTVAFRSTDENFKSTTTYVNVNGSYNFWGGISYNKSFTSGRSKFRAGISLGGSHSYRRGFINGIGYDAYSYNIRPRINFNWDFDKKLLLNPSYNLNYQFSNYENYSIQKSDNIAHVFKLGTTTYWPKNFVFGNDFGYTYNSNVSDGFKKDFFLWNTSLGYNFWRDKLTFKVKVYDVLNQNSGVSRTISDTFISDTQDDVLQRYVMFSLNFKLDRFGGGKKKGSRLMILD